jgi:hypothetical protein
VISGKFGKIVGCKGAKNSFRSISFFHFINQLAEFGVFG